MTIGYALRRLIDYEAAWIMHCHEFNEKIGFGLSVGYTALALESVVKNIRFPDGAKPVFQTKSKSLLEIFDIFSEETELKTVQEFVYSMSSSISINARTILLNLKKQYSSSANNGLYLISKYMDEKLKMLNTRGFPINECIVNFDLDEQFNTCLDENTKKPTLLRNPRRPVALVQSDESILIYPISTLLDSNDGIKRFIHFIYTDIEIPAAEICATNIVEYGLGMPLQFIFDMAIQCSDEVRHTIMAEEILAQYGGYLGEYTYINHIYGLYKRGSCLAEKLAIEQIIGEGNGLDTTERSIGYLKDKKLNKLLEYYEFLQMDEVFHCIYGNKWVMYLVSNNITKYKNIVNAALVKVKAKIPGDAPICLTLRREAGFPDEFIKEKLIERGL